MSCIATNLFCNAEMILKIDFKIATLSRIHTHNRFTAVLEFVQDCPSEQVPER